MLQTVKASLWICKVFSLKDEDNPDYVKTGMKKGKTVEPSTLNKTMIAVSDGKYAEMAIIHHIYTMPLVAIITVQCIDWYMVRCFTETEQILF